NLQRFVPAGDFTVTDITGKQSLISLQGPQSAEILGQCGIEAPEAPFSFLSSDHLVAGVPVMIARHSRCGAPGFDLFTQAGAAGILKEFLVEHGGVEISPAAYEVVRIEDGVPLDGLDITGDTILLETELDQAVSYTKGCYLGQEIIARIHWRGQPARRFRGLLIEGDNLPVSG